MKNPCIAFMALILGLMSTTLNAQAIKGSENVVRKEIKVSAFEKLHNQSSADVSLVAEGSSIVIEADDNIIPYIEVVSENGKLTIRNLKNSWFNSKKSVKITVPIKTLREINNSGSGNLVSQTVINTPELLLENHGSGNSRLQVQTQQLKLSQTGSGNMELSGKAKAFEMTLRGSGNLDADACATQTAQIKISGSGNVDIRCAEALTATISGSGNITYQGNPKLTKSVSGSGNVQSKGG